MGSSFDGTYAANCGVNIDNMVLVEAHEQSLVLELLREIVSSGVVGLLIVNLLSLKQRQLDLRRIMNEVHSFGLCCCHTPYLLLLRRMLLRSDCVFSVRIGCAQTVIL